MFFNNDTYSPDTIHEEVDKNSSKYAIIWCHFPRTCECWRYRVGIIDKLLYAPGIFFWCLRTIWEQLFPPSWMTILGGLNLQRKKNAHFFRGNNNFYDLTLGVKDNGYLMTNKNIKNPRRSWKDSFFHFFFVRDDHCHTQISTDFWGQFQSPKNLVGGFTWDLPWEFATWSLRSILF